MGQSAIATENAFRQVLLDSNNFSMIAVDDVIADAAAMLRAKYGIRTPDAVQIASAIVGNSDAFLTNDRGLKRVTELRVLIPDELEA